MSNPFIQTLRRGNLTIIRYIPQRSKRNRAYWRRQDVHIRMAIPWGKWIRDDSDLHCVIITDWLQHNIKKRCNIMSTMPE